MEDNMVMNTEHILNNDTHYYSKNLSHNLNFILASMMTLFNNIDSSIEIVEDQAWFQSMCNIVFNKRKVSSDDIKKNYVLICAYIIKYIEKLLYDQTIDPCIILGLCNQLNKVYIDHIKFNEILIDYLKKFNELVNNLDNFSNLNTSIRKGKYSNTPSIVSICNILSQIDKICINDYTKIECIKNSMIEQCILSKEPVLLSTYLENISNLNIDEACCIYIELAGLRNNFIADLILNVIENQYFSPNTLKIEDIVCNISSILLSTNDIFNDFINTKTDILNTIDTSEEYQYNKQLNEAKSLYLNYKLDEAFTIFNDLASNEVARAMYFIGMLYENEYSSINRDVERSKEWYVKGKKAGDILSALHTTYYLPKGSVERTESFNDLFNDILSLSNNGDIFAKYELALLYKYGYGCSKDENKELLLLQESANSGYWKAMNRLGEFFYKKHKYNDAFKYFKASSELGFSHAQNNLGNCYYYGNGVEQDYNKALKWFHKSAEQGYHWGQYNLGERYYNGDGVEQDYNEAIKWFKKSAENNNSWAQNALGNAYYNGLGIKQDYYEAVKWYHKSAEQGYHWGQYNLGERYYDGVGVEQDYIKAMKWFKKSAENNNSWAQNALGNGYYNGLGVNKDYYAAVEWYRKSAEQGYHWGQYNLGIRYYYGEGLQQDYNEAIKWFKKSAENNNSWAQTALGTCYYNGLGTNQDYYEAVEWYNKSAQQNYGLGQYNLANMYYNGFGVDRDYNMALTLYTYAANNNVGDAAYMLSCMYYHGYGVQVNPKMEYEWAKKAAQLGSAEGMTNLGNCYYYGRGITENKSLAKEWYKKASKAGSVNAKNNLRNFLWL